MNDMKEPATKAVYFDMCAMRRPFDDQSILRNRIERIAVDIIKAAIQRGQYKMLLSPMHDLELNRVKDPYEHEELLMFLCASGDNIAPKLDLLKVRSRADKFVEYGFGTADAVHAAFAEAGKADFITCDDELLRLCGKIKLNVWCGTPDSFCRKEGIQ